MATCSHASRLLKFNLLGPKTDAAILYLDAHLHMDFHLIIYLHRLVGEATPVLQDILFLKDLTVEFFVEADMLPARLHE